ncbi:hypothetical protein [Haloplanus halophilus]|uniref:hypothetical protein n=1 Tax=Haloplanus halophilus TaxID=2949993 RepID=UPI00203E7E56|nr:hypothetical protein [Haloplanus sp. GDY1]
MFTLVDDLRNPQYTGPNRCVPCTITNVAIAAVGALALGALVPPLGVAFLVVGLLAIYLRGYLVPGTPAFTRRYFPDWLLAVFDKADPAPTGLDVEGTLVAAGVLVDGPEDLELSPAFAAAWDERLREMDAERTGGDGANGEAAPRGDSPVDVVALAALTDLDPDALTIQRYGEAVVATLGAERIGRWESHAAFAADVAAARELDDWVPRWRSFPLAVRSELLGSLRLFLDRCPACDAPVTLEQDVVKSCCRDYDVIAVSCSGCGSRLLEADFDVSVLEGEDASATVGTESDAGTGVPN